MRMKTARACWSGSTSRPGRPRSPATSPSIAGRQSPNLTAAIGRLSRGEFLFTVGAMNALRSTLPAEPARPIAPAKEPARFFNRELRWIAFNHRVLDEACNPRHPLLERLRFVTISATNLDEFIVVRVAGLKGQLRRDIHELSADGLTPAQQLAAISGEISRLKMRQQRVLRRLLRPLARHGIRLVGRRLGAPAEAWLEQHFREQIFPVITPQALDPAHPFPFVANQGMGLLFHLTRESDRSEIVEMVLIPASLPRLIRLPGEEARFVSIEHVIRRFAHQLFPGFALGGSGLFRILRDSG